MRRGLVGAACPAASGAALESFRPGRPDMTHSNHHQVHERWFDVTENRQITAHGHTLPSASDYRLSGGPGLDKCLSTRRLRSTDHGGSSEERVKSGPW